MEAAPPPSLDTCIKSMISVGRNASSTNKQAELIQSMIGFCIYLSQDQDSLAKYLRSVGKECQNGLLFSETPAIRKLLTDPALFQCILSMLSYDPNAVGVSSGAQNAPGGSSYHQKQGRKRSPSEDVAHLASRKKPLLSPTPMKRFNSKQALGVHPSKTSTDDEGLISQKSIPVFAATILHSIFQHVDHWPVHIMKAFAEDSFGPRNWVDDERCKAFVSNLVMSLKPQDIDANTDDKSAPAAEEYFSSLMARASMIKTPVPSSGKVSNDTKASSSQEKTLSSKEKRKQSLIPKSDDDSSSSSSGEEEVLESESLLTKKEQKGAMEDNSAVSTISSSLSLPRDSSADTSSLHILFQSSSIAKKQVRPRYHMHSLHLAYKAISDAFQDRLNSKSKQNYRLLQVLPSFLPIPRVRCLVSRHLERWLQSPALALLARNLFAHTVQELRCVEPPLPDDLEILDNIMNLNLRANQLSMHIEHVTMISKKLPTQRVAQLIFAHCLQGERSSGSVSNALKPNDDHLRMLRSVYAVLDRTSAANALASSVTSLASDVLNDSKTSGPSSQLHALSFLLCSVVDALGQLYDGFAFVKAIIKSQAGMSKSMTSVNTAARLIFECSLLVTRTQNLSSSHLDGAELESFRKNMLGMRKMILRWCAADLCRVYNNKVTQEEQAKCADSYYERGAVRRGPGAPNYSTVLDVNSTPEDGDLSSPFCRMMTKIRCMLFLSLPSSKEMKAFAMAGEEMDSDRFQRINFCCQYGVDIDDKMFHIILSSPNVTPSTALSVIENLLLGCGSNCGIDCKVDTVWEIYKLAEYIPEFRSDVDKYGVSLSSNRNSLKTDEKKIGLDTSKLPRLAVTSLWWRVSSVALILCGVLPEKVGSTIWKENPTLRALIRMTTSQKYRFPTADTDEVEKQRVKNVEESVRQEEAKIAELLFMPTQPVKDQHGRSKPKPQIPSPTHDRRGMRSSRRQREKKEHVMAIEEERKAAAVHAENMKLRKVLRTLQKNIMLWDPKQEQRKPPKGSIDLLLSVNARFNLAEKLRHSTSPDFLLQTIGEGRSAIERAYDWLIPVISSHPSIIDRLQPSASCFLLLRAYGVERDKNRELLDLTSPLLCHVRKCITGDFGEHHALLAMELLLQDVADENDDRRRCARKVLQEAVGNADVLDASDVQRDLGHCGWLFQMIHLKNRKSLISLGVKYISRALACERGKVISMYISALSEFKKLEDFNFVSTLCELIAVRPHVCSDAFDRFPYLRALAITEITGTFEQAVESSHVSLAVQRDPAQSLVTITIPREAPESAQNGSVTHVVVSSNLLHAAIILISNWQRRDHDEDDAQNVEETSILHLLRYLVIPFTNEGDGNTLSGLSSAKHKHNKKGAVSVEEWVFLIKARAQIVAKHAALSAPTIFIPRLLLCCGMPRTSFFTMLGRLDKMVDSVAVEGKTYEELISPAAVSEWGLPGIGSRRTIKRKLQGRILAYMRIHANRTTEEELQEMYAAENSSFVSWLSSEISGPDNRKKSHLKTLSSTSIVNSCMSDSFDRDSFQDLMEEGDVTGDLGVVWSKDNSKTAPSDGPLAPTETISFAFVNSCVVNDRCNVLEESLDLTAGKSMLNKDIACASAAARALLATYPTFRDNPSFVRLLLKWVPLLTQNHGDKHLWQLIFIDESDQDEDRCHLISLVSECALKWCNDHAAVCQEWILSQQTQYTPWKTVFSLDLVLRFLVVSSEQKSIHCFDYDGSARLNCTYAQTEEDAISLTNLALNYVSMENSGAITNGQQAAGASRAFRRRNAIPDWLTLILLVGRSHQMLVARLILERIDETKLALVPSSVLLRLYVMFPLKMNLSDSKLRNALIQASTDNLPWWIDWRCPLDGQMSEMLSNLTKSPHQRLVQSVTDIAKQHPLIFVRHFNFISKSLLEDGSGVDSEWRSLMKRGRIVGKHPSGDALAQVGGRTVKVNIVLWGYSFNEPVWASVLDVMMALPVEVLFSCGTKIGLAGVLEAYLRLFAVQMVDLQSESNIVHLREKLAQLIQSFKKCKAKDFEDWARQDGNVWQLLTVAGIGA